MPTSRIGRADNAILEYKETTRLKPGYSAAHRGLGRPPERAGRREEAPAGQRRGLEAVTRMGDRQTKKEMAVLQRLGDR